jgi:hypothetical protein
MFNKILDSIYCVIINDYDCDQSFFVLQTTNYSSITGDENMIDEYINHAPTAYPTNFTSYSLYTSIAAQPMALKTLQNGLYVYYIHT